MHRFLIVGIVACLLGLSAFTLPDSAVQANPAAATPKPKPTAKPKATPRPKPTATPKAAADPNNPTFTGKAPNQHVSPAYYPCKEGQIKGNNTSKIYHTPKGQSYDKTFKDVTCFDTADAASTAGFHAAKK